MALFRCTGGVRKSFGSYLLGGENWGYYDYLTYYVEGYSKFTYTAIADVKSCRYEFSDSYTLENPRSSSEGSTFGTEITSGTSVTIPSGTKYLKFRITGVNNYYYAAQVMFE